MFFFPRQGAFCLLALSCTGCPAAGAPNATIVGTVLFNHQAAPGKVVELMIKSNGTWTSVAPLTGGASRYLVSTDQNGQYAFKAKPGTYMVLYLSEPIKDPVGKVIGPNEVAKWCSRDISMGSGGVVVPAFDVAYNGLIYPDTDKKQSPSQEAPLPFFWSTHPQANRYMVTLYNTNNGTVITTGTKPFTSPWTTDPTTVYRANPGSGNYGWEVTIDAGDAGYGLSRVRSVQF